MRRPLLAIAFLLVSCGVPAFSGALRPGPVDAKEIRCVDVTGPEGADVQRAASPLVAQGWRLVYVSQYSTYVGANRRGVACLER